MTIWIDAQSSPYIASWINENFKSLTAKSVRSLGLREATDLIIFQAARKENAIVMSKDSDFVKLLQLHGPPPKLIWITCGNTSNSAMTKILHKSLDSVIKLIEEGETLVEISNI